MKYYFITGTSQGIGKALTETLLTEPNIRVIGTARHQTITHANYRHLNLDLSQTQNLIRKLPEFFPELQNAEELVLVNNAGVIGESHGQTCIVFCIEARLRLVDVEQADDPVLYNQGYAQPAADVAGVGNRLPAFVSSRVRDHNRLASPEDLTEVWKVLHP